MIIKAYTDLLAALSPLAYTDLYYSQYLRWESEEPISLPAIFVEFVNIADLQTKHGCEAGITTVNLHVVAENYAPTSSLANSRERAEALERIFGLTENLRPIMDAEGWNLLEITTDTRPSNCFATVMRFEKLL